MATKYALVFDEVILKQLKKLGRDKPTKLILSKMLDKIELLGPLAGKLLDPKLSLFEVKANRPPIRLYYKIKMTSKEAYVFEFEMKTSAAKQQTTIRRVSEKAGSET